MQKKETAIEVKVGALVLFATGLLVVFVLLLGDVRFGDHFEIHVQFETGGGLKPGADVAISGIEVGNVSRLEFITNEDADPDDDLPAVAVQATLRIDDTYAGSIREDSQFYITTRGVLGEPYVEITTHSFERPEVASGAILRGQDPPRMEILLQQASSVLQSIVDMLDEDYEEISDLVVHAAQFFETVGGAVGDNREALDSAIAGLDDTANEAGTFLALLNASMGEDGQRLDTILSDLEATTRGARSITRRVDGELGPLLDDVSHAATSARDITAITERILIDNEGRIVASLENVESSTENLHIISEDAVALMQHVKDGEGTVGALLVERELYEDMKDLMRIIKQQPWRILWKE